jgi:hypothetical protein
MKKIKITKHVEIIYTPDELLYDGMSFEEIAKEDVRMVGRYGQSYLISAEGGVDEQETITWEIIDEEVITDGECS